MLTNNESGVSLSGTFAGNGGGLTNLPSILKWQVVAGTSQPAQPNTGYVANNVALVTITLPTSPAIGDVVRVSGPGAGGWKIAQNAGHSVLGANLGLVGATWTPRDSDRQWYSAASPADGTKLVAAIYGGQIYTSNPAITTPGTAGYLLGGQNTAIELQYIGNNQFLPVSHEGTIQAY